MKKAIFAIVFLALVIMIAMNFKSLLPPPPVEPTYPGLSGSFFAAVRNQDKSGQIDQRFFQASKVKVSDYRENKKEVLDLKVLSEAFKNKLENPQFEIQIDLFEANDAEKKTATKLLFQISLFDRKTQNKIAEFAFSL